MRDIFHDGRNLHAVLRRNHNIVIPEVVQTVVQAVRQYSSSINLETFLQDSITSVLVDLYVVCMYGPNI